jgi:hypothetical protein
MSLVMRNLCLDPYPDPVNKRILKGSIGHVFPWKDLYL